MPELVRASDKILHHTFDAGEGVLIPAEILEHAKRGCRNFVILQPFGCLPNHVVGRGLIHALKEQYPTAQFLPLDYDPDVSFANVLGAHREQQHLRAVGWRGDPRRPVQSRNVLLLFSRFR